MGVSPPSQNLGVKIMGILGEEVRYSAQSRESDLDDEHRMDETLDDDEDQDDTSSLDEDDSSEDLPEFINSGRGRGSMAHKDLVNARSLDATQLYLNEIG